MLLSTVIQWKGISLDDYQYPAWAEVVGWIFAFCSILLIPGFAIYEVYKAPGVTFKQVCIFLNSKKY